MPYNFYRYALKSMFCKRRTGFFTCGLVNAKNSMGSFSGKSWFLVMENGGQVTELDIGERDGMDTATISCDDFVKHGALSPAPASAQLAGSLPGASSLQDFQHGFRPYEHVAVRDRCGPLQASIERQFKPYS